MLAPASTARFRPDTASPISAARYRWATSRAEEIADVVLFLASDAAAILRRLVEVNGGKAVA